MQKPPDTTPEGVQERHGHTKILMDNNPKTDGASPIGDESIQSILQRAREKLRRRRPELGIGFGPKSILTREGGFLDSEDIDVKEASEASKESPSGDFSPSVDSKSEIQNAKDNTTLLTASVEAELFAGGVAEIEAEQLFRARRYNEIGAREFLQLAWGDAVGNSWEETGCSETWEFCRYLLAHSKFKNLRGGALAQALRRLADLDEELLDVILSEIERVRFAKGEGPLEWAAAMSCQYPLSDPEDLRLEKYNKFLSIAGWLQVLCGDKPIVLPVQKLASELGVTAQMVSHWRRRAQGQGVLSEVARYVAHKQATRFRFAVERFSILRERGNL
jgi:hypothetical protein